MNRTICDICGKEIGEYSFEFSETGYLKYKRTQCCSEQCMRKCLENEHFDLPVNTKKAFKIGAIMTLINIIVFAVYQIIYWLPLILRR